MPKHVDTKPDELSKTQRKKDMLALQKLGETLIELSDSQLAKLSLPDNLLDSIQHARSLKSHESIRRQLQYIGKVMRHIDPAPIISALSKMKIIKEVKVTQFHQVEQWRDKLISEGDAALQSFLDGHPQANRQQLRQIIRKAQNDFANNNNTGGANELFKYLKDVM